MYSKSGKDKLITTERRNLERIFADLPEDKKQIVDGLIEQAAFLKISIRDLQNDINANGYSTASPQGVKKRPEADLHITMSKNYHAVTRQLVDLLPKAAADFKAAEREAEEEFEKFLDDCD